MTAARRPGIEELEARILYSADASLLLGGVPVADVRSLEATPAPATAPQLARWLVVDRRVEDWDLAIADRQAQAAGQGAALSVLLVDEDADGAARLAEVGGEAEVLAWHDAQGSRWLGAARLDAAPASDAPAQADRWESVARRELVVVDGGVEGAAQLAMMWWSRATAACQIEVVVTDPAADGLGQLTALLATRQDLSALHLVSHGDAGRLHLGTTTVDATLLAARAGEVAGWRAALTDDADLLVYGCDVGQGLTGAAFVHRLGDLTGADVAASTDLTGAAALGGDWLLEARTGQIEHAVAFDAATQALWQGTLATYTVTNLNDAGAGSLRQAIASANASGGADTIAFGVSGTIHLASALPMITSQVALDGTAGGVPGIVLNGGGVVANGLDLGGGSDASTLRGLVLQGFTNAGITISDSRGVTVAGNYIGTDASGSVASGNWMGVNVANAPGTVIGGTTAADRNVISGNTNIGVNIVGATSSGTVVQGNYIGTNAAGTGDLGNQWHGIHLNAVGGVTIGGSVAGAGNVVSGNGSSPGAVGITLGSSATGTVVAGNIVGLNAAGTGSLGNAGAGLQVFGSGNTIGGTTAAERNVVSGNGTMGINLTGTGASGNTVLGNWIGLSATGLAGIGNAEDGIQIDGGASYNTLGGLAAGAGNVVSGNLNAGIAIDGSGSTGNLVLGNTIGLAADGSTLLANAHNGVNVNQAVDTTIGSAAAGGRNVISGNSQSGIGISDAGGTRVSGNYIGTDATGTLSRGNGWDGVRLVGATEQSVIGGDTVGAGNLIAFNTRDGISASTGSGRSNAFLANAITANGELGIDIGSDNGPTANDVGDGDTGANDLQNFPVLTSAVSSPAGTTILGSLNSNALTTFRLDFYANHRGGEDGSGKGEGERYLGFVTVSTSITGTAVFTATLPDAWVNHSDRVSATATVDLGGGRYGATSEFSANVNATASGVVVVDTTADTVDGNANSITHLGNNRGADQRISLREAITAVNNAANGATPDKIVFGINGFGVHTIALASLLPTISQAVDLDASTDDSFAAQGDRPAIVLDGGDVVLDGLRLYPGADGSSVRGLNIQRFTQDGIDISGSNGNTVAGNWFGVGTDGVTARGNQQGVNLWDADTNLIGGTAAADRNVLSGNSGTGLWIGGTSTGNQVQGNYVGTTASGDAALGNAGEGIWIESSGNTVGGTTAGHRNVVSGNGQQGIVITSAAATGNVVVGNYIGTDSTGLADLDGTVRVDGRSGVVLRQGASGNRIGTDADGSDDAAERNVISGNNWYGVEMLDSGTAGNVVQGNYIGTDASGLVALGNAQGGVSFWNGASGNQLGSGLAGAGNVISGNETGVLIANGAHDNRIQGNLIGLGADGSTLVGNTGAGVYVYNGGTAAAVTGNLIGTDADGSDDAGERNVISGNYNGVALENAEVSANTVAGNYIGTDATGLLDRGNLHDGVRLRDGTSANTIGGSLAAQRNVISGNGDDAIEIGDEATDGNTVRGNWLGVDAAGTGVLGTGGDGIFIHSGADNSVIGGTAAGSGNWIAGAGLIGIELDGAISGTLVQGNRIGTDLAGTANWGMQQNGILVEGGASGNQIGGTAAGAGNTIAFSGQGGVWTAGLHISGGGTTGNAALGNTFDASAGLGIDLGAQGVTANDAGDADSGANNLQNSPVLTLAYTNGGSVTVNGTLASAANSHYRIELYATTTQNGSGHGEGRRYLGYTNVSTGASGSVNFGMGMSASVAAGEFLTATATRSNGTFTVFTDTSEFAGNIVAMSDTQATVTVDTTADTSDGDTTSLSTLLANRGADGFISLREAITAANNTANRPGGVDRIHFDIADALVNGAHTITVATALPVISDAVEIDATTDSDYVTGSPVIEIARGGSVTDGLVLSASNSTIRGLAITGFSGGTALYVQGNSNLVVGNWVGITPSGSLGGAAVDKGILVEGSGNLVGGASLADRNVVGNTYYAGVMLNGGDNNRVSGNYIGLQADGMALAANGYFSIGIFNRSDHNIVGTNGDGVTDALEGNVITTGWMLAGSGGMTGLTVAGNLFGTDASGLVRRGSGYLELTSGVGVRIGTDGDGTGDSAERNVLADGIAITQVSTGFLIAGNSIGVASDGNTSLGSTTAGIRVSADATGTIGGTTAASANTIAYGGGAGIEVTGAGAVVSIGRNALHGNGGLGIDLGAAGVSANDALDADGGANGLQNFPVLASAVSAGGNTTVRGTIASTPNTTLRIEFFASVAGDPSGHGEGRTYFGTTTVTTDAGGNASVTTVLAGVAIAPGVAITATATVDLGGGSYGGTSEFSASVPVSAVAPGITVLPLGHTAEGQATGRFSVVLDSAPTADVTIALSVADATELAPDTTVLTFTAANWNVAQTVTVTGVDDRVVDGAVWSTVYLAAAVSADPAYDGLDPADVSMQNADNDTVNTLVVDTTADTVDGDTASIDALYANRGADGFISLREAITAANNTANGPGGADRIHFDIAAPLVGGAHTIALAHDGADLDNTPDALPTLTEAVVVDATTDADWAAAGGRPVVVLDGAGAAASADGLVVSAGGSTVRGLVIQHFGHYGLHLVTGGGNTIEGNFIGTNAAGDAAAGNQWGLVVDNSAGNVVGGTTAAARNLISGNVNDGVHLSGAGATGNQIQGNRIGTNLAGTAALGNGGVGVGIDAGASGNTVGGAGSAGRNLIAGNDQYGVLVTDPTTSGNAVQGNWIGVDATGMVALSNGGFGVVVDLQAQSTTVAGNVISGNTGSSWSASRGGIYVYGDDVTVRGNLIGLDAAGTGLLGNGGVGSSGGILVNNGSTAVRIGGTGVGEGNTIAGNTGAGVAVMTAGAQTTVLGNTFRANTGLAIDLGGDGLTANDTGDTDAGANTLLNTPLLYRADILGADLRVLGEIRTSAGTALRIEFFASPLGSEDPTGHGEGATYLGHADVTTDGAGLATLDVTLAGMAQAAGDRISATATLQPTPGTYSATSEFAMNVPAALPDQAPVLTLSATSGSYTENVPVRLDPGATLTDGDNPVLSGGQLRYRITGNGTPADELGIRNEGSGAGQISRTGNDVAYGGVVIGSHTGFGSGSRALEVTFNGNATLAAVQALLRNLTFHNTSEVPDTATRTLELTVTDGSGGTSTPAVLSMAVVAVNDAPVFAGLDGTPAHVEGGAASVLDANVAVGDAELSLVDRFDGATLTLRRAGGASGEDVFSATGTLAALTEGGSLVVGGSSIGTVSVNTAGTLVLAFDASATNALVQSAMRQIAYANSSDAPPASVRIDWTFADGNLGGQGTGGARAATGSVSVAITASNDAPVLADTVLALTVAETDAAPVGAVGLPVGSVLGGVGDVDAGAVRGLAIVGTDETHGTWHYSQDGGSTWTAVGPVSAAASLLLADDAGTRLYFAPAADFAGGAAGALTLRAWDRSSGSAGARVDTSSPGGGTAFSSATDVVDVTVAPVNDAPAFARLDDTPTHVEGAAAVVLDADVSVVDAELAAADDYAGATLTLARQGGAQAEDQLAFDGVVVTVSGQDVFVGGTQVGTYTFTGGRLDLTFGGGATQARVDTLLRHIVYWNASDTPPASVQIAWTLHDGNAGAQGTGGALSATGGTTVAVAETNDAPSGADRTVTLAEDTVHAFSVADFGFVDPDGDGLQAVRFETVPADGVLELAGVRVQAGAVVAAADLGQLCYRPNPDHHGSGLASLTFSVVDDGGVAFGALDTDPTPATLTFDVTAAPDAPVLVLDGTNLVTDGSFDGGGLGWSGNGGVEVSDRMADFGIAAPADGAWLLEVEAGSTGGLPAYVEQTVATEVGRTYVFSVSATTRANKNLLDMGLLSVDGVELDRFTTGADWSTHAVTFTATSATSTLRITSLGSQGGTSAAPGDTVGLLLDDVRVVGLDSAVGHVVGAAPTVLAPAARVVDVELALAASYGGATLTLARQGGASADDGFSATGTLAALTEGGPLVVDGIAIGTVTTHRGGTLALQFDAGATGALVDAALQQIAYAWLGASPPVDVQIDWTFHDGAQSAVGSTTVALTVPNAAPLISGTAASVPYAEGDAPVFIADLDLALTDGDSADFDTGTLTVSLAAGGAPTEDVLGVCHQGVNPGQIGVDGTTIRYGGTAIGTFTGGTGGADLVVTFNASASRAAVQTLLLATTYANTDTATPTPGPRTVRFVVTDGDGGTSNAFDTAVVVGETDDAPVITSGGGGATATATVAENTTAVAVVTATDLDHPAGALTYRIAGGADAARFTLDSATGVLRFASAPDHEAPGDAGADNVYDVLVEVSDGQLADTQSLAVTVTDVSNALVVSTTADTVDGDTTSVEALNASAGADGRISLREALLAANQTPNLASGPDRIGFSIPEALVGGAHTLAIGAVDLPAITDAVVIDGSTEPQAGAGPVVVLDGGGVASTGLHVAASDTTVRGLVLVQFTGRGLLIDSGAANVRVVGNHIGTDVTGLQARGNGLWGIDVVGAGTGLVIGGSTAADRNIVAASTGQGGIALNATAGATVIGNHIGVGADGTTALGNATGVLLFGSTTGARVGGTAAGEGNLIAHGTGAGIAVWPGSTGNALLGNRLHANAGQGIDLNWNGVVEANDAGDVDAFQNHPVLTAAYVSLGDTVVDGTLQSTAGTTLRIEFFSVAAAQADADGHGEASVYLGFTEVTTDDRGIATFSARLAGATTAPGDLVTATATVQTGPATYGRTSEYAANVAVTTSAAPVLGFVSGHHTQTEDAGAVVLASGATVSDVDSTSLAGGRLVVQFTANGQAEDRIAIRDQGRGPGQIGVSGDTVFHGGVAIGTWSGGTDGMAPLVVSFGAAATPSAAQALLRNITYANVSDQPSTLVRTLAASLDDGAGGLGNAAPGTLGVVPVNDAPVVHAVAVALAEGGQLVLDAGGSSDPDDAVLSFSWDLDGDGVYGETGEPVTAAATVDWATLVALGVDDSGGHPIGVRVTDAQGASSVATALLTVADRAPALTVGGTGRVTAGQPYTLTLSASDPGRDTITGWTIDWGDGTVEAHAGNPSGAVHVYRQSGATFTVRVAVTDEDGVHAQPLPQAHQVSVDNAALVITSDGGGATAALVLAENGLVVTTVTARDVDLPAQTLTYRVVGGADADRFAVDSATGVLRFAVAPDHEAPGDADADNVYAVTVQASDGVRSAEQSLTVRVTNRNEAPVLVHGAVTVAQGGKVALDSGMLLVTDVDTEAAALVYAVSEVRSGTFQRVAEPGVAIGRFTQADVAAGRVMFVQSGGQASASFVLAVSDGGLTFGPHRVVVQVQPVPEQTLPAPPSLGVDRPSVAAEPGYVVALSMASVPTVEGRLRAERVADPAIPASPPDGADTPDRPVALARAAAARVVAEAPPRSSSDGVPPVLVPDVVRQTASELLVMLDVPIDLSGFGQDRVALLQWRSAEERTRASADAARQQGQDDAPFLRWDSGQAVQVGSVALSVGLVFWATRATGLVASLLAVAPPWRAFDPLPVLSVHAPRQPEGTEVEWLDTDITGSLAELAEDILDQRP